MSRNVSLLNSVFASDAETVVPISPAVGIPYRNPNLTSGKAGQGWPFSTVVDSADFNELMFRVTGLMDFVEKTGGIIWSPLTDYPVGAFVRDEQFIFWEATKASGPNNGGSQNPYIGSQYWKVAEIGRAQDTNSIVLSIVNQVLTATLRLAASSGLSVGVDGVRVALNPSLTNAIKIVNGGLLVETVSGQDIRYMQQQAVFFDGSGVVCCGDWNIGEWEDSNEWPLIWDHGDLSIGSVSMIGPEDNMSTIIDCGEWNNEENQPF